MFLTKRRDKGNKKAKPTGPLFLYGQELKYVDTVDHLGIRIDSRLSWNSHLDNKIMKTKRCMLMCRNVLSKMYEPKPLYMRWLYTSVIRPQLTYGCYAWAQATKTAKNRRKLSRFIGVGQKECVIPREERITANETGARRRFGGLVIYYYNSES